MESREQLEHDTRSYFNRLCDDATRDENALAELLNQTAREVDYCDEDGTTGD